MPIAPPNIHVTVVESKDYYELQYSKLLKLSGYVSVHIPSSQKLVEFAQKPSPAAQMQPKRLIVYEKYPQQCFLSILPTPPEDFSGVLLSTACFFNVHRTNRWKRESLQKYQY